MVPTRQNESQAGNALGADHATGYQSYKQELHAGVTRGSYTPGAL